MEGTNNYVKGETAQFGGYQARRNETDSESEKSSH
jgi:hypothetical protein